MPVNQITRLHDVASDIHDVNRSRFGLADFRNGNTVGYPKRRYMSMVFPPLHARSIGHIHFTSASDIYAPPDFDDGLLSESVGRSATEIGV